jgi:DNA phosphorothioation-dependent restriction protein DptG
MVVVTDTTTAVMCRRCQVVVVVCQAVVVVCQAVVVVVAVIKTSKSHIKELFRRFAKKGVFADNIYVNMIVEFDRIYMLSDTNSMRQNRGCEQKDSSFTIS